MNDPRTAGRLHRTPTLGRTIAAMLAALRDMFDGYQPERHYMRGPGPKWHARHAALAVAVARDNRRVWATARAFAAR
jgi:hypothetical protein